MNDSILTSVKSILGPGITEDYDYFDSQLIMHINTVFMILNQLGVGPEDPFSIEGPENTWSEFLDDPRELEMVKSYMSLKVSELFDPAQAGTIAEARKRLIDEFEWRLNVAVDN